MLPYFAHIEKSRAVPYGEELPMHWEPIEYVSVIQHDRAIQLGGRRFEETHAPQAVAPNDVVVCLAFATADGKRIHRTFTFEGSEVFVATSLPQ